MKVKIVNESNNSNPTYATPGSSGMDLRADFSKGVNEDFLFGSAFDEERNVLLIFPGGRALIPTNIKTAIPEGYEIQLRSRSGLALKQGVFVTNGIGTIDEDFRNFYGVILSNIGDDVFEVAQGDRIAQAILMKVEKVEWETVNSLNETERNLGGFGSSGVK
jgi:dUTP pyrophosphatase